MKPSGKYILWTLLALAMAVGCTVSLPKRRPVPLEPVEQYTQERQHVYEDNGFIIARASMHNHTTYSDGSRTPEELFELAYRQGMAILAYNDHREDKLCVGKGLCVKAKGVEHYGYDVYFDHIRKIQAMAPERGMIVLKGVEVIPWPYQTGKYPYYVIGGLFQHFTVYGIDDAEVLANMPVRNVMPSKPEQIPDAAPWQNFVDYINRHGGMVHAVHVELNQDEWFGALHVYTPAPINNLHRVKDLTCFSVLPAAWHENAGGPGGLWDTTLLEYMAGLRERPLWGMGDADYHGPDGSLANATTMFYLKDYTEEEVFAAMRSGRMIALMGESFQDSYVAEWYVSEGEEPLYPIQLGEEIRVKGAPVIRFALDKPVPGVKLRLIRNGVVIMEQEGCSLAYTDLDNGEAKVPAFYRVEAIGPVAGRVKGEDYFTKAESELFTNPIFVRFKR